MSFPGSVLIGLTMGPNESTQVGRHSLDKKGSTWALVTEIRKRKQRFSFSKSCCTFQLLSDAPGDVLISCLTITQLWQAFHLYKSSSYSGLQKWMREWNKETEGRETGLAWQIFADRQLQRLLNIIQTLWGCTDRQKDISRQTWQDSNRGA